MKKKLLPILLLAVVIFNFIFCGSAYADPDDTSSASSLNDRIGNSTIDGNSVQQIITDGSTSSGTSFNWQNFGSSLIGAVVQSISAVINSFPITIETIISMITMDEGDDTLTGVADAIGDAASILFIPELHFTIEKTVFNLVGLFNINIFDTESTYRVGTDENNETVTQSSTTLLVKDSTAAWYYSCRLIAMMINLCILIYVGIRMAISTIASEEAKYKKMLINWLQSMVVLFILPYIMYAIIELGEIVLNILYSIRAQMIANGAVSFESTVMMKIYSAISEKTGIQLFMYSVFFWFLTYIHLKFFFKYFKRLLTIAFLTIIGPFITVTYPIDKMADNKAQAFSYWTKEYIINVAMQPIHAAVYLVFIYTAGAIAEQAPFVSMMFLLCIGRIENIVRNIFGLTGTVTMGNINEEMKRKK